MTKDLGRSVFRVTVWVGIATTVAGVASAQESKLSKILGAEAVLRKVRADTDAVTGVVPAPATLAIDEEAERLRQQMPHLAPKEAAVAWLDFAARSHSTKRARWPELLWTLPAYPSHPPFSILPEPSVWPTMAAQATIRASRKNATFFDRVMAAFCQILVDDVRGATATLNAIPTAGLDVATRRDLAGIYEGIANKTSEPDILVDAFSQAVALMPKEGYAINLPNLVGILGERRAAESLRAWLPQMAVGGRANDPLTEELACKIALEVAPRLRVALWELADSHSGSALYPVLRAKFPPKVYDDETAVSGAKVRYVLNEIRAGRIASAEKAFFADREGPGFALFDSRSNEYLKAGLSESVMRLAEQLLRRNGGSPYVDAYVRFAVENAYIKRATSFLKQLGGGAKNSSASIHEGLRDLYFASGRLDEGATEARKVIATKKDLTSAMVLADRGEIFNRPDWIEEGLQAALAIRSLPEKILQDFAGTNESESARDFVRRLCRSGRSAEAESLLAQCLAPSRSDRVGLGRADRVSILAELAGLYADAGRYDDVLTLFERSDQWGFKDLAQIYATSVGDTIPLGHIAAVALAAKGRNREAIAIEREVLRRAPFCDEAYTLYLRLDGSNAETFIKEQIALFPNEGWPRLWRALLYLRAGNVASAEREVRNAMTAGPENSHIPTRYKGLAYEVLAKVYEANGQPAEAVQARRYVSALRLESEAWALDTNNLPLAALAKRKAALAAADATPNTHLGLARTYLSLGDREQAKREYRRGLETLPQILGELKFNPDQYADFSDISSMKPVGEQVYAEKVRANPKDAVAWYLLGCFRNERKREKDAFACFRRAAELRPDSLAPWKRMASLTKIVCPSGPERERISIQCLRLEPAVRWFDSYRGPFEGRPEEAFRVAQGLPAIPSTPGSLLPLPASAARLVSLRRSSIESFFGERNLQFPYPFYPVSMETVYHHVFEVEPLNRLAGILD